MSAPEKALSEMTAVELRAFARREGLTITHLAQRRRDALLALIQEALRGRDGS